MELFFNTEFNIGLEIQLQKSHGYQDGEVVECGMEYTGLSHGEKRKDNVHSTSCIHYSKLINNGISHEVCFDVRGTHDCAGDLIKVGLQ